MRYHSELDYDFGDVAGSNPVRRLLRTAKCATTRTMAAIEAVMLCAGVSGGCKDICQGDSGGPSFDWKSLKWCDGAAGVPALAFSTSTCVFPAEELDRCDDLLAVDEPSCLLWGRTDGNTEDDRHSGIVLVLWSLVSPWVLQLRGRRWRR
jgi:hypothetical protein